MRSILGPHQWLASNQGARAVMNELAGLIAREPLDVGEIIDRLIRQILTRAHTATRKGQCQVRAHAFEQQQIIRRMALIQSLLAAIA